MAQHDEKRVKFVTAVRGSLRKAGFEGGKLEAATARIAMASQLGMLEALPTMRITRTSDGFEFRSPDGKFTTLDAGIAAWARDEGAVFVEGPLAAAAQGAFRNFMTTPEGRVLAQHDAEAARALRAEHAKTAVDWMFGEGFADSLKPKSYTGPKLADLPTLPTLKHGEVPPMEWLRLRDQREAAEKAEGGAALLKFITDDDIDDVNGGSAPLKAG